MSIPCFLSSHIRVAEDLGGGVPLVCWDGLTSRSIGITHDLKYKKRKRKNQTNDSQKLVPS